MGLRFERGLLLRLAGALAHLVVAATGRGALGSGGGGDLGGGRSYGLDASGAMVHGGAS